MLTKEGRERNASKHEGPMPVRIQPRPCAISHSSLKAKLWTSSQTVPDGSSIKGRGGFVGVYTHNGPVCTGSYFTLMRCGIVLLSERQGSEKRLDSGMMSQINWHVLARPTQKYDLLVWHTLSHSQAQVLIKYQNTLLQTKAYNLVFLIILHISYQQKQCIWTCCMR